MTRQDDDFTAGGRKQSRQIPLTNSNSCSNVVEWRGRSLTNKRGGNVKRGLNAIEAGSSELKYAELSAHDVSRAQSVQVPSDIRLPPVVCQTLRPSQTIIHCNHFISLTSSRSHIYNHISSFISFSQLHEMPVTYQTCISSSASSCHRVVRKQGNIGHGKPSKRRRKIKIFRSSVLSGNI